MKDTPAPTFNRAQDTRSPRVGMLDGKQVDADQLGSAETLLLTTPVLGDAL